MSVNTKKVRRTLFRLFSFFATLSVISFIFLKFTSPVSATWYDDTYAYRLKFAFTHNTTISSERAVTLTLDTAELIAANLMQGDCDDTRFTDNTGKLLKFELTGTCNNASTTYEVVFPNIINGTNVGYVYYANPAASSASVSVSGITALTPSSGDPSDTAPTSTDEQGPSPILWFPFSEGYGSSTQDGTINNYDGTFGTTTASPTWKNADLCQSEKCVYLDGGDYITNSTANFRSQDSIGTFEVWYKPTSFSTSQYLFSSGDQGSSNRLIGFSVDTSGRPYIYQQNADTADNIHSDTSLVLYQWNHIVISSSGSAYSFYVNGSPTGVVISGGSNTGNWFANTANRDSFSVGDLNYNNTHSLYATGFIDELKIYPYQRTASQIKSDFASRGLQKSASAQFGAQNTDNLTKGLVGYWKLDENTGTSTADSSGNGNNSTTWTSATWNSGKFGSGTSYTTNQVVRFAETASTDLGATDSYTVSSWAKTSTNFSADACITCKLTNASFPYALYFNSSEQACFQVFDGTSSPAACSTTSYNDGVWHLITGTRNASTHILYIYVDGTLINSTNDTTTGSISNNDDVSIGNGGTSYTEFDWTGQIDETRIYNRTLSPNEVSNLYNFAPGPSGYWKMDENNGNTANDSSGYNHAGSMSVTQPTWTIGKAGSALNFSNATYLEGSVDAQTTVTLSAWIYMTTAPTDSNTGKILALGASGTSYHYLDLLNTSGVISARMVVNNNGSAIASSTSTISPNTWYHLEGTYDPNDGFVRLFVNGVQESKTSFSTAMTSTSNFNVGIDLSHTSNRAFTGKIDEAKVYNYARTSKQVIEDMNGGHPTGGSPVGSQLIYWSLDQNAGSTVYNSVPSQSTLTGTISGATILDQCYVNACAVTASTTDYISGGDIAALDSASNLSFTLWYSYLDNTTQAILSKWNNSNQDNFLVSIESGTLKVYVTSLATQTVSNSPSFSVSNIDCNSCHLAIVYDGTLSNSDRIKVYKNGIKQSGTVSGTIPTSTTATTSNFKINASDDVTTYTGSLAVFDEVKVYTSSLSDSDVLVDMNAGSSAAFGGVLGTHDYEGFSGNAPLAWWKFDDNKGSTVADNGGYNHTQNLGASTAAPIWTIGKSGSALKYDGSNDYSSTAAAIDLSAETTITVEFWLNWDAYANDDDLAMEFTPNINSNAGGFIIDPNFSTSGTFAIWQMNSSGTPSGAHFVRPSAGAWHHYAIILDKTAASALDTIPYVDGAPMAFAKQYTATMDNTFANNTLYFMSRAGSNLFGAGKLDDVRIYNYARTPAQIAYDYNRGNPILQYNMDECSGSIIHNSSLNSNGTQVSAFNGTLALGGSGQISAGDCTTNASTPWYTGRNGKFTSSLNFDGQDDVLTTSAGYILAPNTASLTSVSWGAWFNPSASPTSVGLLVLPDHFRLSTNASDHAQCATGTYSNNVIASNALPQSTWTHIMCVYDGTTMKIYLNGILNNTTTVTDNFTSQSASLRIANESPSPGYYAGQIDDVRIYNYALTDNLVKRVSNEGSAVRFGP